MIKVLSYLPIRDVWQLPIYHGLLLGALKNLLKAWFASYDARNPPSYIVPHASRRIIKARASELKLPAEFGRPVR